MDVLSKKNFSHILWLQCAELDLQSYSCSVLCPIIRGFWENGIGISRLHFVFISTNNFSIKFRMKGRYETNKTRSLESAPYLRLKKRKTVFWKKTWNFWKNFFQKKSHSAEKCKRGTLVDLLTYNPLQNIRNLEGGPFGDIKKFSKKSRSVPKKIQKGGPFGHVRFCMFPWKSK